MLGAQLRSELARPTLEVDKIRSLCKRNPIGCIVDNKVRTRVWSVLLLDGKEPTPPAKKEGDEGTELDPEDTRVIEADVKRTRGYLPMFQSAGTQELIRSLLTNYCINSGMKYKQGMHEILAPFVALSDPPLGRDVILSLFTSFVSKYLAPFLTDDEFKALKAGFRLFQLLLLYHDPVLAQHLIDSEFPPSLYVTPWVMTLFAHNLEMYLVHRLWDMYLSLDDAGLVYFLALALLQLKRDTLLRSSAGELPERISEIRIRTAEDIATLVPIALEASRRTPRSFCDDLKRTTMLSSPSPSPSPSTPSPSSPLDPPPPPSSAPPAPPSPPDAAGHLPSPTSPCPSESFIWHSRHGIKCVEVTSAELVASLLLQQEAHPNPNPSPTNLTSPLRRMPSHDASAPPPAGDSDRRSNMGGLLGSMLKRSTSSSSPPRAPTPTLPASPRPATPTTPTGKSQATHNNSTDAKESIRYVVLDVRVVEDYVSSGVGHLHPSLRMEPQVMLDPCSLMEWLGRHDLRPDAHAHICVVGSKLRSRRSDKAAGGGEGLWRRLLLGEGDGTTPAAAATHHTHGEEEGEGIDSEDRDYDTAEMLIRALRARGFPLLCKLRGGLDSLIDWLTLTRKHLSTHPPPPPNAPPTATGRGGAKPYAAVYSHDPVLYDAWRRRQLKLSRLPSSFLVHTPSSSSLPPMPPPTSDNPFPSLRRRVRCHRRLLLLGPSALSSLQASLAAAEKHGHASAAAVLKQRLREHEELVAQGDRDDEEEDEEEESEEEDEEGDRPDGLWGAGISVPQLSTRDGTGVMKRAMSMFDQFGQSIIAAGNSAAANAPKKKPQLSASEEMFEEFWQV